MELIWETLWMICVLLYRWMEGMILVVIPTQFRKLKDVSGEIVLITGAGSGIGRLMSVRFAQLGCRLVLWDVNKQGNEETAKMVKEVGGEATCFVCDLSNHDDVYNTAARVKQEVGDVNILVNNAGIVTGKKFLACPDNLIQKTMEVNINAHFWTTKSFLPAMMERNHGHLVNVSSSAGLIGVNGLSDYCASKFAAVGFDESIRTEIDALGKDGVFTTAVCPFYINTGMFDGVKTRFPSLLPILEPEEAVNRIMDAVLTNQQMLYMPRLIYVFLGLKGILPVKCTLLLSAFFGASNSMDDFKGRDKKTE